MRDVAGAFVMPGLVDVHNHHAVAGQEELFELRIPIGADLEGILAAVRAHAATLPADAWVVGGPWMSDRLGGAAAGQPGVVLDAEGRPTGVLLEAAGLPVAHPSRPPAVSPPPSSARPRAAASKS